MLPVRSAEAETVKLILGLEDGECVESVLLPRQGLCVSTQVGCAVGCVFCMTGKGGLVRQLSSAEIVAQYCEARRVRSDVRKIVLMGMGEPSHNLDAVCEAVEFFGNVCGLAHKDIVVSTVGDHRLFDRLPALSVRPALALSLHTTDNALRRKLLTNSKDIPVETLLERTLDYADETGYPAQIEWTLMAGINDAPEQVERLAAFKLDGLPDTEGKTVKLTLKWKSFSGDKSAEFDYCTRKSLAPQNSAITSVRSNYKLK